MMVQCKTDQHNGPYSKPEYQIEMSYHGMVCYVSFHDFFLLCNYLIALEILYIFYN